MAKMQKLVDCELCGATIVEHALQRHQAGAPCKRGRLELSIRRQGLVECGRNVEMLLEHWPSSPVFTVEKPLKDEPAGEVSFPRYFAPPEGAWLIGALCSLPGWNAPRSNRKAAERLRTWVKKLFGNAESFGVAAFIFQSLHTNEIEAAKASPGGVPEAAHAVKWADCVSEALDLPKWPTLDEYRSESLRVWQVILGKRLED